MNEKRAMRISQEMKRALSHIIHTEMKDPRLSEVTSVNGAKVTRDLSYATFYISILGDEHEKKATMDGLEAAKGFIRKKLSEELDLRQMPELIFKLDETIENAMHIEEILKKIRSEQSGEDAE